MWNSSSSGDFILPSPVVQSKTQAEKKTEKKIIKDDSYTSLSSAVDYYYMKSLQKSEESRAAKEITDTGWLRFEFIEFIFVR